MKDEAFEILTKMYAEFSARFDKAESDMQRLQNDLLRIEHDHGRKMDGLFDGYNQTYEKLGLVEGKIDRLTEKVDKHDIDIQVIGERRR